MPKMKTNRAAGKRFKVTGSGKVKRGFSGLRHGMIRKSRGRKRTLSGTTVLNPADAGRVLRMLGKR